MADTKSGVFQSEDALLDYLTETSLLTGGAVAIVAGHFMLAYDDQQRRLVPMVLQDTGHPWVRHFSQEMAQDFPLRSFRLGLQVQQRLRRAGRTAGMVLLVNDHIFQTKAWHEQNLPTEPENLAASLRHESYRNTLAMPASFSDAIRELAPGDEEDVFIRNDNPQRTKTDIVPKRSVFFSEQALRRRFDEKTRHKLVDDEHFKHIETENGKYRVYFREDDYAPQVCLIDEDDCGCSGEVVELLLRLQERGISTVLFFSPQECASPVHAGAKATAYIVGQQNQRLSVITISGLGGMGVETAKNDTPELTAELVRS